MLYLMIARLLWLPYFMGLSVPNLAVDVDPIMFVAASSNDTVFK